MSNGSSIELIEVTEGSFKAPTSSKFLSIDGTIHKGPASGDINAPSSGNFSLGYAPATHTATNDTANSKPPSTHFTGDPSSNNGSAQSEANHSHQEQLAKARLSKEALGASDSATIREEMRPGKDYARLERLNKERTKDLFDQSMHLLGIREEPGPKVTRFLTTFQEGKTLTVDCFGMGQGSNPRDEANLKLGQVIPPDDILWEKWFLKGTEQKYEHTWEDEPLTSLATMPGKSPRIRIREAKFSDDNDESLVYTFDLVEDPGPDFGCTKSEREGPGGSRG